jgi:hypothetical protein
MSVVKAMLAKTINGFAAADERGEALHKRMGAGECALFKVIRPRSLPWHRKYFGICGQIGENQDPPRDEDSIDHEVRILAGHYEKFYVGGVECRRAKRIAFDQLTADEWAKLWPSLEQAIRENFGGEYFWEDKW